MNQLDVNQAHACLLKSIKSQDREESDFLQITINNLSNYIWKNVKFCLINNRKLLDV